MSKKATPILDHHLAKIIKVIFGFPDFLSTYQKSVYSSWDIANFLSKFPETRMAIPVFVHVHANIFWSTFDFHESVSILKKSGFFIFFF